MSRYVDADKMITDTKAMKQVADGIEIDGIIKYIEENATADVQTVKHGKWIPSRDKDGIYEEVCSECGYIEKYNIDPNNDKHPNYCPNCCAKMDGAEK